MLFLHLFPTSPHLTCPYLFTSIPPAKFSKQFAASPQNQHQFYFFFPLCNAHIFLLFSLLPICFVIFLPLPPFSVFYSSHFFSPSTLHPICSSSSSPVPLPFLTHPRILSPLLLYHRSFLECSRLFHTCKRYFKNVFLILSWIYGFNMCFCYNLCPTLNYFVRFLFFSLCFDNCLFFSL